MPSGLTSTTPDDLILNVATLYVNGTLVGGTPGGDKNFGVTKGGLDFDPGRKDRQVEFDGLRAPIAELEYPINYAAKITGKIIQFGSTQVALLEPGASSSTSGTVTTYPPIASGTRYASGDYLSDVQAVWTRGDGGLFVVKFPTARVLTWKVDSKDKQETEITVDIRAYLSLTDAASSTDTAPYQVIHVAA